MPLNLKSTSGGGITLAAAPTAVDLTVTVPATNGTLVTAESLSAGSGASRVGYLPAGTGAVATDVQSKLRERISVLDFGSGLTHVQVQAALSSGEKHISCIAGETYSIGASLSIPADVTLDMNGATFVKSFNGNTVGFLGKRARVLNGRFDGSGATYSGSDIVIDQGGNSSTFSDLGRQRVDNCVFENSRSYCIDYPTGNYGTFSRVVNCEFVPLPVSSGGVGIAIRWPNDTLNANGNRHIIGCYSGDTLVTTGTCQNGFLTNNTVGTPDSKASVIFGSCYKIVVVGNRFAHGNNLMTVLGSDHSFTGNVISSLVDFDAACTNVSWATDNVFSGFNGVPPYGTNNINSGNLVSYTPTWTASGSSPSYGNADIRAAYRVNGRICSGWVQITFGTSSNFGSGQYSFSLPVLASTLTKKYSGAAWVQGFPCTAWIDPNNAIMQLYTTSGTIVTDSSPVALSSGHNLILNFEYEIG